MRNPVERESNTRHIKLISYLQSTYMENKEAKKPVLHDPNLSGPTFV
jgi:hypothetical protein